MNGIVIKRRYLAALLFVISLLIIFICCHTDAYAADIEYEVNADYIEFTSDTDTLDKLIFKTPDKNAHGYWIVREPAVVAYNTSSTSHNSEGYSESLNELYPVANGSTYIDFVLLPSDEVITRIQVTCSNITEYYPIKVTDVKVSNKNYTSVTGSGISGKVSYDPGSNTLTLDNAVLTKGAWAGDNLPSAIFYDGDDPLKIKLIGDNEIRDMTTTAYEGKGYGSYGAEFNFSYNGAIGVNAPSKNVTLTGSGTLGIGSPNIGTCINCDKLTIDKGTSVGLNTTFGQRSYGIDADSVTVNGTLITYNKTRNVTSYGINTKDLTVGASGSIEGATETTTGITSNVIKFKSGGSASVKGSITAASCGASGEFAGTAIEGFDEDYPTKITVSDGGKIEAIGVAYGMLNCKVSLGSKVKMRAGGSEANAYNVTPHGVMKDESIKYVLIGKSIKNNIKPVTLSKVTKASKAFTVKWKKNGKYYADGYQIRYSLKSSMKSAKKAAVAGGSKSSKKITKLTSGKKYYVQVRAYKTVNGKKAYSAWSKTKSVKVK